MKMPSKEKEIMIRFGEFRIQDSAADAIKESAETFITSILSNANVCYIHGKRIQY